LEKRSLGVPVRQDPDRRLIVTYGGARFQTDLPIHTTKDVGLGVTMSAVEAVVLIAVGTAAAIAWAVCLEARRRSRPPA
jgi:hypothetical protein